MKAKVGAISTKQGANGPYYGLMINGTWYTCFNQKCAEFTKGQEIEYELVTKGEYTNLELKEAPIPDKDVNSDMQRSAIRGTELIATPMTNLRLEAMKLAVKLICSGHVKTEDRERCMIMILGEIEVSPLTEKEAF